MDFSKLDQNEKLAIYGSAALLIGGVIGYSYSLTVLGMLAAVAMLLIVFLPQLSAGTALPGSRGSLMVIVGGLAGISMALAFLSALFGVLLVNTNFRDLFFIIAVAGGLLMAWAGWQAFQAEGGKLQLGGGSSASARRADAAPASGPAAAPAAPASQDHLAAPAAPAAPASEDLATGDERPA